MEQPIESAQARLDLVETPDTPLATLTFSDAIERDVPWFSAEETERLLIGSGPTQ